MAFVHRTLAPQLRNMAGWYPVVSLSGPRQSGKSTLVKHTFPDYGYVTLEDPQIRASALEDPISFIRNRPKRLIVDEAQYAPNLFSMIQVASDEGGTSGQYILTGSQNFLMMKSIRQSLAGRIGLLKLLPFSFWELQNATDQVLDVDRFTLQGGYPRLHDNNIPPTVFYSSYVDTYIERDVADVLDVRNKDSFRKLLAICAHGIGGLVNMAALAGDAGVSAATVKSWLSVLEESYIVFRLRPYFSNMRKRLVKTPKLYFYDTGLLCHLLHIETVEQLVMSPLFGAIFENLIVAETMKRHLGNGRQPELFFYRDESKREIDLLDFTDSSCKQAVEIKSSMMYHDKYARHLAAVCPDLGIEEGGRFVASRVSSSYQARDCKVVAARDWLMVQDSRLRY